MRDISVHFSSKSNEWETPKNLFNILNKEFNFILDAASTKENALCAKYFTKEDNALEKDWYNYTSIYCNPPYGRLVGKFIKKGFEEAQKGGTVVFLVPARTDTNWWYEYCSKGEVRFIKGRLKFNNRLLPSYKEDESHIKSPAPFPCAIIIFKKHIIPKTSYVNLKLLEEI